VPELKELAHAVGGWQRLAELAHDNPGSLAQMAAGRRRVTRKVHQVVAAYGVRPAGWDAKVAAIVAWAESAAPRNKWKGERR
jgi:hypothetical protein